MSERARRGGSRAGLAGRARAQKPVSPAGQGGGSGVAPAPAGNEWLPTSRDIPSRLPHILCTLKQFSDHYDSYERLIHTSAENATLVSSVLAGIGGGDTRWHAPVLDIDFPTTVKQATLPDGPTVWQVTFTKQVAWRKRLKVLRALNQAALVWPAWATAESAACRENRNTAPMVIQFAFPTAWTPSSTAGHGHLWVDGVVPWPDYRSLLRALAEAGLVEEGWVRSAVYHYGSLVRVPWLVKSAARDSKDSRLKAATSQAATWLTQTVLQGRARA